MANLRSSGIRGHLVSAKATGKKILDKFGQLVPEIVDDFVSGFAGHGWKIWKNNGRHKFEIDDIVVRNTMTVFELLISKVRAIRGAMGITQANGKVKSVREDETNFYIAIEEEMSFVANDIVRCLEFNGGQRNYWVTVSAVNGNEMTVAKTEFANTSTPVEGDELVQFGNTTDTRRQSAIYFHADENGQPAIDVMFGISKKSFDGCVKVRLGGDLPGTNGVKGFYSENGMIKGVDSTGHTVYCLYPDGTAELGAGSALFKPDKSGHIADGAISWQWDAAKNKYVCTMGDVILQWDNLSPEVQENLKGEPGAEGQPGQQGTPGKDGENGKTSYLHIKYSNDGGLTFTENNGETVGAYIGICADFNANDPTDVSAYKWVKIKGEDANLLPWVEDWNNNKTQIGDKYLISPKIFTGSKDQATDTLTGVALGRGVITVDGKEKTGIFGIKDGKITFSIDAETGESMYSGKLNVNNNFIVDETGKMTSTDANVSGILRSVNGGDGFLFDPDSKSFIMFTLYLAELAKMYFMQLDSSSDSRVPAFHLNSYISSLSAKKTELTPFGLSIYSSMDGSYLNNSTMISGIGAGFLKVKDLPQRSGDGDWKNLVINRTTGEICWD